MFKQTLATYRPGGEGSRTAGGSCRRPHHRCRRGHHRGGRTRPTHPLRARRCATARDQHRRRAIGRRADEATSPTYLPARACGGPRRGHRGARPPPRHLHGPRRPTRRPAGGRTARRARYGVVRGAAAPPCADAAAALTAAPPAAAPPHSSPPPLSDRGQAAPPLGAGKGTGSATAASPAAAAAAVAPAIAATATGGGCDGGGGGGWLWSMAPPSPLPPLAGVRTTTDAPAADGGAEFDGGLTAAAAAAPNRRGRGDRDGCDGRPAAVCTSEGPGIFVCLSLGGEGAAVTAAAWAAVGSVLVGGALFAEDARPREGGGSRGLVVGGCFARCKQVQGISANAFSVPPLLVRYLLLLGEAGRRRRRRRGCRRRHRRDCYPRLSCRRCRRCRGRVAAVPPAVRRGV